VSGPLNLFELISDGNVSLMRAVEKFDFARGFRFSTYASWAIMRNFARSVPKERYQLDRFSTGHEEVLDIAAGLRSYDPEEENLSELRESITVMLDHLSARERTILINHYGLDESASPKTFDQLGQQLGISKERVRQIEIQALDKLRAIGNPEE
jgi:RNA polymerase sigma factor (sigma-70 family)